MSLSLSHAACRVSRVTERSLIHVSAVSEVGVLQEKCSRQPVPRGNYKFKLKMPPGLAAVARLLRAACRRVNAPVVFLCFYFAARLSRRSRAACRVPCKRSFRSIACNIFLSLLMSYWRCSDVMITSISTEALKGHCVLWKIEICYLIRMT